MSLCWAVIDPFLAQSFAQFKMGKNQWYIIRIGNLKFTANGSHIHCNKKQTHTHTELMENILFLVKSKWAIIRSVFKLRVNKKKIVEQIKAILGKNTSTINEVIKARLATSNCISSAGEKNTHTHTHAHRGWTYCKWNIF